MRSVLNTLRLCSATLLIAGCATGDKIPNVRFYAEIPFVDCPEGVYVESLTRKTGTISCEDWAKQKPYMILIDPAGKKEIFNQWSSACRWAGKQCNVQLETVKDTIDAVDKVAGSILKKP